MKAVRIHTFGPPSVMVIEDLPRPTPGPGEVLVHVAAAGVGPWDALIREHKSVVHSVLPLILGSDVSGVIEAVGPGVSAFQVGDDIYGVTNPDFCGAYTEYALASAAMVARKPHGLSPVEAASVPVVAVTAWQMLFEYAQAHPGQTVLIHRRFSRCGIDSHSSLSASAFSRNTDALCEGIFRPRGPKATLLLTGPHRLIVSRGSAELPGRRVQWLSALPRDNGKNTSHWSLRVPGTASRTCMPL